MALFYIPQLEVATRPLGAGGSELELCCPLRLGNTATTSGYAKKSTGIDDENLRVFCPCVTSGISRIRRRQNEFI